MKPEQIYGAWWPQPLKRTITVTGPALPTQEDGEPVFILSAIRGEERLSTVCQYDLILTTSLDVPADQAASVDTAALIGTELTVTIQLEGMGSVTGATNLGAGIREISGIVTEARFLKRLNRQCQYALVLQPWIALLDKTADYRIFQNMSVIEIVEDVLHELIYSWQFRTGGSYERLGYVVMYNETLLGFIQRMLVEAGIAWYVEHSNTVHRIVFVDNLGGYGPVASEAYHTLEYHEPDQKIDREYIDRFESLQRLTTGVYTTDDYNFRKPRANLTSQNALQQDTAHGNLERREWPGNFAQHGEGEAIARLRMEALRAPGERAFGHGKLRNVVCGTSFRLANHPNPKANREYITLWAALDFEETSEATGSGAGYRFEVHFEVQPATVQFRPDRSRCRTRRKAAVAGDARASG
jgi:type VI secretion system secreted protein VgrG